MARIDNMQACRLTTLLSAANGQFMTRYPLLITLAAAAALAGCSKHHTIVASSEPADTDTNVAVNGPVALPPAVIGTKLYRCADNSVVTVDYLSDNKSANVHAGKGETTQVVSSAAGKPMTASGGYSVEGSPTASSATIAVPGHPSQTCTA